MYFMLQGIDKYDYVLDFITFQSIGGGGLGPDEVPNKRRGSYVFLLPPAVLGNQASRTEEQGFTSLKITLENASHQQFTS